MRRKLPTVGDYVYVAKPYNFVRCGYPISKIEARMKVARGHGKQIEDFLNGFFGEKPESKFDLTWALDDSTKGKPKPSSYDKIVDIMAYEYLKEHKFGGNDRKLFVSRNEQLLEHVYRVSSWKNVVTGTRFSASSYQGSEGTEYEHGGLDNMRSHKILTINRVSLVEESPDWSRPEMEEVTDKDMEEKWREVLTEERKGKGVLTALKDHAIEELVEADNLQIIDTKHFNDLKAYMRRIM